MSIHLNHQVPTPTLKRAVQLAAWENSSGALKLVQPHVSEQQIGAISHIFEQCAKDPSNAPETLKQLVSVINLSEFELLPNELLQKIFAQTLVHDLYSLLEVVSKTFHESISDPYVISLVLELPEWQSETSLTLQEIRDFQQDIRGRCGLDYSLAAMLKKLPNIQLDLTDADIDNQLLDEIIMAAPYLKNLNLSSSTINDQQLVQIAQAAPRLRSLDLSGCQNLGSPHLTALTALTYLDLSDCSQMQNPPVLTALSALRVLNFSDCLQMQNPPVLTALSALRVLNFSNCFQMQNSPVLTGLTALTELHFSHCIEIENPPILTDLIALNVLDFSGCSSMQNPPILTGLRALRILNIRGCNIRPDTTGLSDELFIFS